MAARVMYRYRGRFVSEARYKQLSGLRGASRHLRTTRLSARAVERAKLRASATRAIRRDLEARAARFTFRVPVITREFLPGRVPVTRTEWIRVPKITPKRPPAPPRPPAPARPPAPPAPPPYVPEVEYRPAPPPEGVPVAWFLPEPSEDWDPEFEWALGYMDFVELDLEAEDQTEGVSL